MNEMSFVAGQEQYRPKRDQGEAKAPGKFDFEATKALAREMMRAKTFALKEKVEKAKVEALVEPETIARWEEELTTLEARYGVVPHNKPGEERH
jgi:hypothetical protein